jgi:hypothetical protein
MYGKRGFLIVGAVLLPTVLPNAATAYYSPRLGRWISRDPGEEEKGGLNSYAFIKNSPIAAWDYLGLWGEGDHYRITKAAAKDSASLCVDCATKIAEGAYGQDTWHQMDWPRHFMTDKSGKLDGGAAQRSYITWELQQMHDHLRKGHCLRALYSYGKVLHTIQDGFSHIDGVIREGNTGVVIYEGKPVGHYAATPDHHGSGPNAWYLFKATRPDSTTLWAEDWAAAIEFTDRQVRMDKQQFLDCPCSCGDPKAKRGL